jgi:hypothetical protein
MIHWQNKTTEDDGIAQIVKRQREGKTLSKYMDPTIQTQDPLSNTKTG